MPVYVPCSNCYVCKTKRSSAWSFRLVQHSKLYNAAYFVTLTYNNDHVPITNNGFLTVRKSHFQNFIKKLRRNHPEKAEKISYYGVSEYGTEGSRPHYHLILFGCNDREITEAWTTDQRGNKRPQALGNIYFGTVEGASIGYVLKYINKPKHQRAHQRDDRELTNAYMSKGIGANYLTPRMIKYHHRDIENRVCVQIESKLISMPKYYKDRIYDSAQKGYLKGYFEATAYNNDDKKRKDHAHMTNYEYEKMLAEQHRRATKKFITDSQKNRL